MVITMWLALEKPEDFCEGDPVWSRCGFSPI